MCTLSSLKLASVVAAYCNQITNDKQIPYWRYRMICKIYSFTTGCVGIWSSDFACIWSINSKWIHTVQHAHASSISLSPSSAATSGLNEFLPIAAAQATHTHTNRMQSIGFSVRIKTSICKHTLHCVTVATNGTLYTWLWTVRQLLGTSLCILCVCCGQCLPEKKLSSISTVGVTHIPFRSKEESWNHIFIYEVPFRQKANHFPQCTPQAKPRRVAAKHKYPRACWQPGKRNIEPSVW